MEEIGSSQINTTSALENCETSAIGRALASAGYHGTEFCSANELENALNQQSNLKEKVVEKFNGEVLKEKRIINFGKHKGKDWSEVPDDYLDWVALKSNVDWQREEASKEISRRKKPIKKSGGMSEVAAELDAKFDGSEGVDLNKEMKDNPIPF